MLAAIPSLATMSTSNKISSNIPLASTLRISPHRAQLPLSVTSTSLRSEALRKFVSLSTLSLCLVTRKFVEFSRDFSTSVSFFFERISLFFFSVWIPVAMRRRRNTTPMLHYHGVTIRRERSTLVAHLNGSGYKYATELGDFMRIAPASRLFSIQFSRLIRSNFAANLA